MAHPDPSSAPSPDLPATSTEPLSTSEPGQAPSGPLTTAPSTTRWTNEQTLCLLELLLEARREGRLKSSRSFAIKPVFENIAKRLESQFKDRVFSPKRVDNKYRLLRQFWRVFEEAERMPGTVYSPETGRLNASKANEEILAARHHALGRVVIQQGLLINEWITFESWEEIFSEELGTGEFILEADDDAGFARAAAREAAEAKKSGTRRKKARLEAARHVHDPFLSGATPGCAEGSSSRALVVSRVPRPPSTPSEVTEGRVPRPSLKRRRQQSDELMTLISGLVAQSQQPKKIMISSRMQGAEDFEKAAADIRTLFPEEDVSFLWKAFKWLAASSANPLIWNALRSEKMKREWMERVQTRCASEDRE
ncbi:hypothetical protein CDD80_2551 [Ophiocordyceps camponoti-rufipedis]|uniref:Myb/SANT-like domain-containing protein n=1 Tax=Ophiocordyceps camponoti-rufipedis TaxID=2004952 RepID=A0A2C5ZK60_9HYPO|nr:hypothetical protein CDD80_2551 [Ophiocordyceps camponoti-rufipedis]